MDGRSQAIFTPTLESMSWEVFRCVYFHRRLTAIKWECFQKRPNVCGFVWVFMLTEILRMTRTSGKVHDDSLNFGWSARSSSQHHFSFKSIKIKDAVLFWFDFYWQSKHGLLNSPFTPTHTSLKKKVLFTSSWNLNASSTGSKTATNQPPNPTPPPKIRRRKLNPKGYLFLKIDFTHGAPGVAGWNGDVYFVGWWCKKMRSN